MTERIAKRSITLETILVVDDAPGVLTLVVDILQTANFNVLQAADGGQALQLAACYSGAIDMLLSDVRMPGMSGTQLAEALEMARPGIQVMLMSGYSGGDLRLFNDEWALIEKPFHPEKLVEMIHDLFRGSKRPPANREFDTQDFSVTNA